MNPSSLKVDVSTKKHSYSGACACCSPPIQQGMNRRGFLQATVMATGVVSGMGLMPGVVQNVFAGPYGNYEAMVLACIDPRVQGLVYEHMNKQKLVGQYSQFVIAGASIGVVAPAFKDWQKAFWDNLDTSVKLHKIKKVIAINHRDCGAARIAYGDDKVRTPEIETETHRLALVEFATQLKQKHPTLVPEIGLMALDGSVQMFRV